MKRRPEIIATSVVTTEGKDKKIGLKESVYNSRNPSSKIILHNERYRDRNAVIKRKKLLGQNQCIIITTPSSKKILRSQSALTEVL